MNQDYKYFLELIQQDLLPSEQESVAPEFDQFINKIKSNARNARKSAIDNVDPEDRPRIPIIGEVINTQVDDKPMVFISLEHQGTFRLEGKQAGALVDALAVVGIEGNWT